jgi:ankyrin repeat protein
MRDVLEDIAIQFQQPNVKVPTREDLDQCSAATLETALQIAVRCGRLDAIENLLEANRMDRGRDGWIPLSWAAQGGYEAVVKLLLNNGADANQKGLDGRTHEAVVKLLLEKGADANWRDRPEAAAIIGILGGHKAAEKSKLL